MHTQTLVNEHVRVAGKTYNFAGWHQYKIIKSKYNYIVSEKRKR